MIQKLILVLQVKDGLIFCWNVLSTYPHEIKTIKLCLLTNWHEPSSTWSHDWHEPSSTWSHDWHESSSTWSHDQYIFDSNKLFLTAGSILSPLILSSIYIHVRLRSTSNPQIHVQFLQHRSFLNSQINVQFSNLWPFLTFSFRHSMMYTLTLTHK
jgi:hypothetical protein